MTPPVHSDLPSASLVTKFYSLTTQTILLLLISATSAVAAPQQSRRSTHKIPPTRLLESAARITHEADLLRSEWSDESLRKATGKYKEAQSYYHRANEPRREADILKQLGDVHFILSRYDVALSYYKQALELSTTLADQRLEVDLLNQISKTYLEVANASKADSYCHRAHDLSVKIQYQRGEAEALGHIGVTSSFAGDVLQAQDSLNRALAIWQQVDYDEGRASTLLSLGYLQGNLGNTPASLDHYQQALAISQSIKDRYKEARSLTAIGGAYALTGEKQKALNFHNQALKLLRKMGNRNGEAATLNGIGYVYDILGDRKLALRHYLTALQRYQALDNRNYAAITLGYIGRVYSALGNKNRSLHFYNQKLISSRTLKDRRMEAYTLKDVGDVLDSADQKARALEYYQQALHLSRSVMDRRGEAYVLESIGSLYDGLGQRLLALSYYQRSLSLMEAVTDRRGEISNLYRIARTQQALGNMDEARSCIEKSISLIEDLRTNVVSPSRRISYLETVYKHYEFYVDLLMTMDRADPTAGYNRLALEVNERARARTLLENLSAARMEIRQGVDPDLLEKEKQLQQRLNQKAEQQMRLLSSKGTSQQASTIKNEIEVLISQLEEVKTDVREKSPWYAALTQPRRLRCDELQAELGPDSLLIEYSLGTDRSYVWAVTATSVSSFALPKRSQIEAAALDLYKILAAAGEQKQRETPNDRELRLTQAAARYPAAAARLSGMLLGPIASLLGSKRLVIVADGILQYIPFTVLVEPNKVKSDSVYRPLVVNHEIVTLPSLSILAVLRREVARRQYATKGVAIFADPVFEQDDPRVWSARTAMKPARSAQSGERSFRDLITRTPDELGFDNQAASFERLPFTLLEAQEISKIVPATQTKLALGFDANLRAVMDPELRRYRIIHFATHGLLNNSYPELSGIVLSLVDESGHRQDGFLRLNEIYNLHLAADLVVLSACRTGLGKEVRGEGLIGLTRGFMHAGVPRVVASLWRIDDRAAAELMTAFYEAMFIEQLPPAAALRQAQIHMWETSRWKFPHHWAAFVLQGEWN